MQSMTEFQAKPKSVDILAANHDTNFGGVIPSTSPRAPSCDFTPARVQHHWGKAREK